MRNLPILAAALALAACATAAQDGAPAAFDGARAFRHLERITAIGPRPSGSPGAAATRAYIIRELKAIGLEVETQAFEAATPAGPIRMVNLRAVIRGSTAQSPRVIVAGHYDTKRMPGFVGANDGGSSTAFLLEFARALSGRTLPLPVEILFFDGEEAVIEWEGTDNTYGSRHYVEAARSAGTLGDIGALILVDMIAERNPRFARELQSTPWLTGLIWKHARALGRREFVDTTTEVLDDHIPFLAAGIPAVDIIDFDYAHWHTPGDTLDKVSPEGLQAVGDVLLAALPDVQARLRARTAAPPGSRPR